MWKAIRTRSTRRSCWRFVARGSGRDDRPYWLTHAVQDITSLGGVTVLSLMTLLTTAYLVISRRIRIAIFTACSILGGWLVSTALKVIIARPRPDIVPHLVDVRDLSFPSGHAMLSAVTYLTLGALLARTQTTRATRLFMIAAALFLTLIIGLSRIFLGVHYPTDVWAAGVRAPPGPSVAPWWLDLSSRQSLNRSAYIQRWTIPGQWVRSDIADGAEHCRGMA